MRERPNLQETDTLLLPFLRTKDEGEAQELLGGLVRTEAEPLIKAIIGRKLHVSSNGTSYSRAGLLDEAEREFSALLAANPDSEVAKKLLRNIELLKGKK